MDSRSTHRQKSYSKQASYNFIYILKKNYILVDVVIQVDRNVMQKEVEKEAKIQEFMCRKTMNMEHAMSDYTSHNWSH